MGLWDGKDNGTPISLVGHGKSRGHATVTRRIWDGKDSGNETFLVGHGSLEDNTVPLGLWDGDYDVSGGTWEVQRTPHNPKGTLGW